LRTTHFGNGAEKVRKYTVNKPGAMAARKKVTKENVTLDDLQQNEDERGSYQPLWKTYSESLVFGCATVNRRFIRTRLY
jgi:hypothetical protein